MVSERWCLRGFRPSRVCSPFLCQASKTQATSHMSPALHSAASIRQTGLLERADAAGGENRAVVGGALGGAEDDRLGGGT